MEQEMERIQQSGATKRDRRIQVTVARRAIKEALGSDRAKYFVVCAKNEQFQAACTALWIMGYWPAQIAKFIGDPATESLILMALRNTLCMRPAALITVLQAALEGDKT
jgi:hypothetical protein